MRVAASAFLSVALLLEADPALADAMPKFRNAWFMPVGVSGAVAIHQGVDAGFAGGLELSVVRNDNYNWMGAYADVVRDFAVDTTRFSVGPELGEAIFGIDGGYVFETGRNRARHGAAVRPMLSLGFVMLYGRAIWLGGASSETLGEVGVLLKFPIELRSDSRLSGPPDLGDDPPPSPEPSPASTPAPSPPAPAPPSGPSGPFAEPPPE